MSTEDHVVRHVFVRGRVQGIGFRRWAERQALAHGLEGWARNRRDGSVEAVLAGPAANVAAMLADLRRGPLLARVDRLDEHPCDAAELMVRRKDEKFSLLPTV
jgi:acylphosphatase